MSTATIPKLATRKRGGRGTAAMPAVDDPAADLSAARIARDDTIVALPIDKLHDHPLNPDTTEAEVLQMAEWLDGYLGQLEPLTVRPGEQTPADHDVPVGHYQVLAGKTRLAAARRLGWDSLAARVRHDLANEAAAIEVMAGTNQQRRIENPLRQAAMIQAMMSAGASAIEAGRMYGLESANSVANKLRLLELPEVWRQRVTSGEIKETVARQLVPYVAHHALMRLFEQEYKKCQKSIYPEDRAAWQDRDGFRDLLLSLIHDSTRPIETGDTYYGCHGGRYNDHRRLFELNPEIEAACQIVSLPIGENGKMIRRALNIAAYDAINDPLLAAKYNQPAAAKSKSKPGDRGATGSINRANLTPAEQKAAAAAERADAKRRRAEADKKLAADVEVWRQRFLRMMVAGRIESGSYLTATLLPFVMANTRNRCNEFRTEPAPLGRYLEAASVIVAATNNRCPSFLGMDAGQALQQLLMLVTQERLEDEIQASLDVQAQLLRFLIWPQCETRPRSLEDLLSPEPPQAWRKRKSSDRTPAVFLLELSKDSVDTMAKTLDVTVADGWRRAGTGGSGERALVDEFLCLHTRDQLNDLAGELLGEKSVAAEQVRGQKRRDDAIELLLSEHTSKSPLKLPAILSASNKPRRKKK